MGKRNKNLLDHYLIGIIIFYLGAILIVWDNNMSLLTDDAIEILYDFQMQGYEGFQNSYGFTSLYYAHDILVFLIYKLVGDNNTGWFYIMLFIHSTAGYFMYRFLVEVLYKTQRISPRYIAACAVILMLFSANIEEIVYWPAALHYVSAMLYLSTTLYFIAQRKGQLNATNQVVLWLTFGVFLTMLEMVFFFPFAYLGLILYYRGVHYLVQYPKRFILFLLPFGLMTLLYLLVNYKIHGVLIPHYGSSHLDFGLYDTFYKMYLYIAKHVFLVHSMDYSMREKLYDVAPSTMYIFFSMVLIVLMFLFIRFRKQLKNISDYALLTWLTIVFFIPISSLYFMWIFPVENGRYAYFLVPFLFALMALFLSHRLGIVGRSIMFVFVVLNLVMFKHNTKALQYAVKFSEEIIPPTIEPYLDSNPIILNMPQSFKGVYMFRHSYRLERYAKIHFDKNPDYTLVANMPFLSTTDSVTTEALNDSTLLMRLAAPGSWFMYNHRGLTPYETDELKVEVNEWMDVTITFKGRDTSRPILYVTAHQGFVELQDPFRVTKPKESQKSD